ncbi:AsmA-like C-terminal region-containing protein, partial [Aquibium sp. A9E412]|uniref:AsmA-like C-terminal region-containing protein n=1 Tax=Aquibium sp. A9E412 TaxID=2976767 RepID=UPI0025AED289
GAEPLGRDATVHLRFGDDGLALSDLSATLHDGRLEGLAELKNNAGTGLLSAQLRLVGADVGSLLPVGALDGRADVSASVTANGKSVGGLVAALSGSGTATFDRLVIDGLNPRALPALLGRADAIGHEVDAEDTAGFAPPIVGAGAFRVGAAEIAFTLAGGTLRTPPVRLVREGAVLTAELRADLTAGTASAEGRLTYDAGLEALAGSEPAVRFVAEGPLGAMSARFDTQPLAQYLTQRALEREQARVEHMQAVLLEKQRLRRETRYYAALEERRERAAAERRRFEEEAARQAAEEARRAAEEAAPGDDAEPAAPATRDAPADAAAPPPDATPETPDAEAIRRAPLPPPDATPAPPAGDDVSEFFRPENLTVEGLRRLIEPAE